MKYKRVNAVMLEQFNSNISRSFHLDMRYEDGRTLDDWRRLIEREQFEALTHPKHFHLTYFVVMDHIE